MRFSEPVQVQQEVLHMVDTGESVLRATKIFGLGEEEEEEHLVLCFTSPFFLVNSQCLALFDWEEA
jgi:hypothetical protein